MKKCKFCHEDLPAGAHGKREYCNDAHKQAHWRQQQEQEQREKAELVAENEQLKSQVEEQKEEITTLYRTIRHLKYQINLEHAYLMDTQSRGFIPFLQRQPEDHPARPLIEKILADPIFTLNNQLSHWTYERVLRFKLHCSDEEMEDFKNLWKLMMLETYSEDL